ncbi:unnamed protein product [Schistocephalus solidus]|uniref:PLAT domain-containing protein n=1 Tax=Schistocephalus solidus TaxID=70667 RepID=A0A183SAU8_SCHSO|nr:unnamed protein product [Schistocephalus solidus]
MASQIFITLVGKWGVTPRYELVSSYSEGPIDSGTVITFRLRAPRLGGLTHIRLYRDTIDRTSPWYIERIVVSDLTQPTLQYIFNCMEWFGRKQYTLRSSKIFSLTEMQNDFNGGLIQVSENRSRYRLWLHTANTRGAGTTADVFVQLADGEKTAGEHWLRVNRCEKQSANNMEKSSYTFSAGSVVEANVNCSQPLKQLERVRVGHNNRGHSPDWFLEKVRIGFNSNDRVYLFALGRGIYYFFH